MSAQAQTDQDSLYLKEMPKADQVRAAIQGTNTVDRDARLVGAFYQLSQMLQVVVPVVGFTDLTRPNPVREEQQKIRGIYDRAWQQIANSRTAEFGNGPQGEEWKHLYNSYMVDESLREQLFKAFLSPQWQAKYRTIAKAEAEKLEIQAAYTKGMPTVERVMLAIQGTNTLDRDARQYAAFRQLAKIMQTMMTGQRYYHGKRAPSENRLFAAYDEAAQKIVTFWSTKNGRRVYEKDSPELAEWRHRELGYEKDEALRQELLTLFTPEWVASYSSLKAKEDAENAHWEQQRIAKEVAQGKAKSDRFWNEMGGVVIVGAFLGYLTVYAGIFWLIGLALKGTPKSVTGTVTFLGQSQLFMEQGRRYSIIKIEDHNDKEQSLSSVLVGNDLESELTIGAEGTFAFYGSHNCMVLCGSDVEGKVTIGTKERDPTTGYTRISKFVGILCQVLGLLTAVIFGLGFLVMAFGLYYSARGISRRPSDKAIKAVLDQKSVYV